MRKTISDLEQQLRNQEDIINSLTREISLIKVLNDSLIRREMVLQTMTISLEKVTDAVAHVLGDLTHMAIRKEGR